MKLKTGHLSDAATGRLVVPKVEIARNLWSQTVGLMGRAALGPEEGLLIPHCNSIHTCFVRFPLDVVFLDGDYRVIKVISALSPWRLVWPVRGAKSVLELSADTLRQKQITVGQKLLLTSGESPANRPS